MRVVPAPAVRLSAPPPFEPARPAPFDQGPSDNIVITDTQLSAVLVNLERHLTYAGDRMALVNLMDELRDARRRAMLCRAGMPELAHDIMSGAGR